MSEVVKEEAVAETEEHKEDRNYFTELQKINVSKYTKKKGQFTYLSWTQAVAQLKMKHPDAVINVKRFPEVDEHGNMFEVPYLKTNRGYFVEVEVIVNGVSVSEPYPITDHKNQPVSSPNARQINDAIQRAKVKSIAGHGLGIYIFMGDEFPTDEAESVEEGKEPVKAENVKNQHASQPKNQNKGQTEPLMTKDQWAIIQDLVVQMAALKLGANPSEDEVTKTRGELYKFYKINKTTTSVYAEKITPTIKAHLKAKLDERVQKKAEPAMDDAMLDMGEVPADDLGELI